MKAVTRAADEPRPVLWASWRRTPKSVNLWVAVEEERVVVEVLE